MSEMLIIGLHAEGSTDYRFLKPVIRRTIEEIILDCDRDIELHDIVDIDKKMRKKYIEDVLFASEEAYTSGIKCLILHCDADSNSVDYVMSSKINPAKEFVEQEFKKNSVYCTRLIPLIPIYMTEAWMLADLELLKSEINAEKIDNKILGFTKKAENYSDPKEIIKSAISIAQKNTTKHRRTFNISELYRLLGNKISLKKLKELDSYQLFYQEIKKICLPYC